MLNYAVSGHVFDDVLIAHHSLYETHFIVGKQVRVTHELDAGAGREDWGLRFQEVAVSTLMVAMSAFGP